MTVPARFRAIVLLPLLACVSAGAGAFVNFETPHVHPLDLSPDGGTLAVVNTAANRLLLYDVAGAGPRLLGSVPVGLDPVTARFRSNREVWVVNQISDSVSIVDVATRHVRATLDTLDEPADVVFAGSPERAFVSCSQVDTVLVFDPRNLEARPRRVAIGAEDPRAMAVSPDGRKVYVAVFESGNRSTVLAGGFNEVGILIVPNLPRNVVSDPEGPYGGQNPPPNRGSSFEPPIAAGLPPPPPVSLIVKKGTGGRWLDDNGGDWTEFVSGSLASRSGRRRGWDVIDRDVAVIDAGRLSVRYVEGLMNANMAIAVNPSSGRVSVAGTDAINEVRFEPLLNGRFLRVALALVDSGGARVLDLNPHLTYETPRVSQAERNRSLGDPRAIVWSADGERGFVAGMGSNNVVVLDADGNRIGRPIEVAKGPTGLALDDARGRLYVLNRFSASLSVIDAVVGRWLRNVKFADPTPAAIRRGRPFLYDTHATSGLGHVSCASCHIDGRTDRLGWDLGAPDGAMKSTAGQNKSLIDDDAFADWHPMKGPMTTQTLQDIIGHEPHHWRGDRDGLEEFAAAFSTLLGDDRPLPRGKMRRFERFLATLHFPPNPYRELDNSLPRSLSLRGHRRNGRFGRGGRPLPRGNARRGLELFRTRALDGGVTCNRCHALPTGGGTPAARNGGVFEPIARGPRGEQHQALIGEDFSAQLGFKVPQLRNAYDKVGMDFSRARSRAGFGFFHDGSVDSLARFVGAEVFDIESDQEVADLVALVLALAGSGLEPRAGEPPGVVSQDAHAAVGRQATVAGRGERVALIGDMVAIAAAGAVDLVAVGREAGGERRWTYDRGSGLFTAAGTELTLDALLGRAAPGAEITFTVVPAGEAGRAFPAAGSKRRRGRG